MTTSIDLFIRYLAIELNIHSYLYFWAVSLEISFAHSPIIYEETGNRCIKPIYGSLTDTTNLVKNVSRSISSGGVFHKLLE